MKKLFAAPSLKDSMIMLWGAAVMCLVLSVFVWWAAEHHRHPVLPDHFYTPRLICGILLLMYWTFYVLFEVQRSALGKWAKLYCMFIVVLAFPVAPLLFALVYARNLESYKKLRSVSSDMLTNVFYSYCFTYALFFVGFALWIPAVSCGCHSVIANSILNFYGFLVLTTIVAIAGIAELRRVSLPVKQKRKWLIIAFLPTVGLLMSLYVYVFMPKSFITGPLELLATIIVLFLPFLPWMPIYVYTNKYLKKPEDFKQWHPDSDKTEE